MENDPSVAFQAKAQAQNKRNGKEPVLGGELRSKAVWVDESLCIGCTYCSCVATNTFSMEPINGRARAIRQDGDSSNLIQEAIDTCPVNCIDWVRFEDLDDLRLQLEKKSIRPLGLPPLR
ncbi:ferredoxin [Prochlorococcus marinus]|uniref:ferredoxin n=1 Tax=Prochlorococcus marinus TaxID=1219 RepID=UPI0022B35F61|nr:ferredoxin [Prochlorococcus marinus]